MPHFFTAEPSGFQSIQRAIIARHAMVYAILVLVVTVLHRISPPAEGAANSWPSMVLMLAGVMVFTTFMTIRRQKAMFESFRLIITDDEITREMMDMPAVTIRTRDVREVIKDATGGLTIIGWSKLNAITVPAPTRDLEELEELLTFICPLTQNTSIAEVLDIVHSPRRIAVDEVYQSN